MSRLHSRKESPVVKTLIYIVLIFLTILSLFPFVIMVVNSTRNTPEIQTHAVSLIPSKYLLQNWAVFLSLIHI